MPTNRFAIEGFMDEAELKYYFQEHESGSKWVLLFSNYRGIHVHLNKDGDFLLIYTFPLTSLDSLTEQQQNHLVRQLLLRNDRLAVTRYCLHGSDVIIQSSLPIDNSELTGIQFHHLLGGVHAETDNFHESLSAMCAGKSPESELDQLIRRLMETSGQSSTSAPQSDAAPKVATDSMEANDEDFEVVLTGIGKSKLDVVKVVKQLAGRTLSDCKKLVENTPAPIGRWKTRADAEIAVRELAAVGASAVII